jgi:RNA polymerase sigma-70 factor (ECF subfamily)
VTLSQLVESRPFDSTVVDQMAVQTALERLPEDFRVAVVLRDVADLDYDAIADTLGVPIGTVRSRIARGRAILAKELGNQIGPPEHQTQQP